MTKEFTLALEAACQRHPEQRICQVLVNALGEDPFYLDDNEAIKKLYAYSKQGPF